MFIPTINNHSFTHSLIHSFTHLQECPAEDLWGETEANTWASIGCGNGFQRRFCGPNGQWTEQYDFSSCYCTPQSGWPLTLSGSTVTRSCPAGFMSRTCNVDGSWSEIDYSECMCKGVDGFSNTPLNTLATIACHDADGLPDSRYNQTRFCGANGEWTDIDQSQCPVKWCPTVQSWYSVPVGLYPTTVTLGCMSGYRTRVCNINGVWGPVNTDNCRCTYEDDTVETLTELEPGKSYSTDCGVGFRTYVCNAESGYFDPVDLDECFCKSDDIFSQTKAGLLASFSCGVGVAMRKCGVDGQWEVSTMDNCFCQNDDVWPQTHPGHSVSVLCDLGFRRRTCGINGHWESADDSSCQCSENGRVASYGQSIYMACGVGFTRYECGDDGHFKAPETNECQCASEEKYGRVWPITPAGSVTATITCMNGEAVMRTCSAVTGLWQDLDAQTCRCTAEDVWEEKGVGEIATAPCANSAGTRRRQCYGNQWGPVDDSECMEPCVYYKDDSEGEDIIVPVGQNITVPCYVNMEGMRTYVCQRNVEIGKSVLVLAESNCTRLACLSESPADPEHPFVYVGETETVPCALGFTGTRTRTCEAGAQWGEFNIDNCEYVICDAISIDDKLFTPTRAGQYATVDCPSFHYGNYSLYCNEYGQWDSTYQDNCQLLRCPQEGSLPESDAGTKITVSCPSDYTGSAVRTCNTDGTWSEPDLANCTPLSPTVRTIPFNGMTHVSRTPSAVLLSSLALQAPYDACNITVRAVNDADEQFQLRVNVTKTEMVGRHRNGALFADFVVSEEEGEFGEPAYLGYGEYEMTFPACWRAINTAVVPEEEIKVVFHTAPVPPSAPSILEVEYGESTFTVHFNASTTMDDAYPVIAYYLAFQPPVLPEVRVDASARSFGPFAYVPGELTLLLRAESALGLSSPDVMVAYSFDELIADPEQHIAMEMAAPELALVSQVYSEASTTATVTVAVAVPEAVRAFAPLLTLTCNDEAVTPATALQAALYTTSAPAGADFTVTCYFTLGTTSGQAASLVVSVPAAPSEGVSTLPYSAVELTAVESHAQEVSLSWTAATLNTETPIDGYRVECRRQGEMEYTLAFLATALQATFSAAQFGLGPVECRVAATSLAFDYDHYNWSAVAVIALHRVTAENVAVAVQSGAVTVRVDVTAPACVPAEVVVRAQNEVVATAPLTCGPAGEEGIMTGLVTGLTPSTAYDVEVIVPSLGISQTTAVSTTAATVETLAVEVVEASATAASLKVTASSPDVFYCVAATTPVSAEQLQAQIDSGLHLDEFVPATPVTEATVYLLDLHPATAYAVTCIARYARTTVTMPTLFTTTATDTTLAVLEVTEVTPGSRLPAFLLTFNSHIQLAADASLWVHCGGLYTEVALTFPVAAIEGVYSNQLRVDLAQSDLALLPAGTTCTMGFTSLAAVQRLHAESSSDLLGDASYMYTFAVTEDGMQPVLTTLTVLDTAIAGEELSLMGISEVVFPRADFSYNVVCSQYDQTTVSRTFSTEDHPIRVVTNGALQELAFYVGLLPYQHQCELLLPAGMLVDAMMNPAVLSGVEADSEGRWVIAFTAPASVPERR